MLKRFLLNSLSSFVGAWIAVILVIVSGMLLFFGMMGSMALSGMKSTEQVKSRSVLVIDLNGVIEEREMPMEPDIPALLQGNLSAPMTLDVLVQAIREAADNDDIVAIYLKGGSIGAQGATLNALRNELLDFRKTTGGKKKIIAYADSYNQGTYYVASAADEVYMNPAGEIELRGLASGIPYLKGLFDKLGIEFQVVKVGTFKSAVEPYIMTRMSDPARAQMDTLLGNTWLYMRTRIAESRPGLTAESIDSLVNKAYIACAPSKDAVRNGLVDTLVYERYMDTKFADLTGREVKKLNFVSPTLLASQTDYGQAYGSKRQVAVLYACGEIADGNNNQINFENLVPVIKDLAEDDNVKALVLRVNSPGGSVFGSDQIGEALDYFQSKGKKLAVSMGDYAASGGYWISCHANRIFADALTITGSIGIFGMLPNISGTLDKIGVNIETVETDPNANFPSLFRPMDAGQMAAMQAFVDRGYDQFVTRVATGRKMKKEQVLAIAEGRVWDAMTAKKIGLVDEIGGLQDAVKWAAANSGLKDNYDVAVYPQFEPTIWNMIQLGNNLNMGQLADAVSVHDGKTLRDYLVRRILARKPVQAIMPEFRIRY